MRDLWKHLESLHNEATGENWRERAEFEPAPAEVDVRAHTVIGAMLDCLWSIIIAGVWNWLI